MINTKDQEDLFRLISKYIKKDVQCFAIGGTAMMFYGYKNTTNDIDLVFNTEEELATFLDAITELGYTKKSIKDVYSEKKQIIMNKPLIYSRGQERFDLFLKEIFGFKLHPNLIAQIQQKHEFIEHNELILNVLPIEYLILLKSITNRD
ncbi:hypothetical protein JW868_04625, partial [Candidatus Woesearchaeota archaeon]|nr:hypothetical protein [Candidatus Woesearchaeota archaeon]